MAEGLTKEYVENIISQICDDFRIVQYDDVAPEQFNMLLQCKLTDCGNKYDKFCTDWLKRFSSSTCTNWIVKRCYKTQQRLLYRKLFTCQHSRWNKSTPDNATKSRNKDCRATINFKIKKINRNTWKNDPLLKLGLNVYVNINFCHSHHVFVAESFGHLRCSAETEALFISYFESGLSPTAAKAFHEMAIVEKNENYGVFQLANAQQNPNIRHINYLHQKWKSSKRDNKNKCNIFKDLLEKKEELQKYGIKIDTRENPRIIVIMTPLMHRIFQTHSDEMVFIDFNGTCDKTGTFVAFIFVVSKIGALPLACILHGHKTEETYAIAFLTVKTLLEENTNKLFRPRIIVTGNNDAARKALRTMFTGIRFLLGTFQVCQEVWRFLWQNNVDKNVNKNLMLLFKEIFYAETKEECENKYEKMMKQTMIETNYYNFKKFMQKLWKLRDEWCISHRGDAAATDRNAIFTDASVRLFKDIVLKKVKDFNSCDFLTFLVDTFENYHRCRLIQFALQRRTKTFVYENFCDDIRDVTKIRRLSDDEYRVQAKGDPIYYNVHTDICFCDCPNGRSGSFCKHMGAVERHLCFMFNTSPYITCDDQIFFGKLAQGDKDADKFDNMETFMDDEEDQPDIKIDIFDADNSGSSDHFNDFPEEKDNLSDVPSHFSTGEDQKDTYMDIDPLMEINIKTEFEIEIEEHNITLQKLRSEFERLSNLFEENPGPSNTIAMTQLLSAVEKITTPAQVQYIFN